MLFLARGRQRARLVRAARPGGRTDDTATRTTRELSHVLKVFLIDPRGDVREIYSSAFLHPQTVMNDITTLLMER